MDVESCTKPEHVSDMDTIVTREFNLVRVGLEGRNGGDLDSGPDCFEGRVADDGGDVKGDIALTNYLNTAFERNGVDLIVCSRRNSDDALVGVSARNDSGIDRRVVGSVAVNDVSFCSGDGQKEPCNDEMTSQHSNYYGSSSLTSSNLDSVLDRLARVKRFEFG